MGQQPLCFSVVGCLIGGFGILANLFLVGRDLIIQLRNRLPRSGQRIRFPIEPFITMTTHATALVEKIAASIQRLGALGHPVLRMALLAACLNILALKQRPQPVLVTAVAFNFTGSSAAVAPMAAGTSKAVRVMSLKKFLIGMTDKRFRQTIRLLPGPIRGQILRANGERLSYADVANFATVHYVR